MNHPLGNPATESSSAGIPPSAERELSSYSACLVLQIRGETAYVLDVVRKRLEYPDLKRKVVELHRHWADRRQLCATHREQGVQNGADPGSGT